MIDVNNIQFRPSELGEIMVGVKKKWDVDHSLTCKRKLLKIWREIKYSRYYMYSNKYTEKGVRQEEEAITLYSRYKMLLGDVNVYKKNEDRITNDYFTGIPDIISLPNTIDVKCSWSLDTFPHPFVDEADEDYIYQGMGYMNLTSAKQHIVAYCLVNGLATHIQREKEKLYYQMNCPSMGDDNFDKYIKRVLDIEKNYIFDMAQFRRDNPNFDLEHKEWNYDIPLGERVVEFVVNYDEEMIMKIKNRIDECRLFLKKLK